MEKSVREKASQKRRYSVVLSDEQVKKLKKHLIYQSGLEGRMITISEGIRRAIEYVYPVNNTQDMFGDKSGRD